MKQDEPENNVNKNKWFGCKKKEKKGVQKGLKFINIAKLAFAF